MRRRLTLMATIVIGGSLIAGCSGGDDAALEKAAAPTSGTSNAPPVVPGKKLNKMPPLTGPNAGKGGPGSM